MVVKSGVNVAAKLKKNLIAAIMTHVSFGAKAILNYEFGEEVQKFKVINFPSLTSQNGKVLWDS